MTRCASSVITFALSVCQYLGFGGGQIRVVTGFLAVSTGRDVPLVFCDCALTQFQRTKFGVVALVPAVLAILCVTLVFCSRYIFRF